MADHDWLWAWCQWCRYEWKVAKLPMNLLKVARLAELPMNLLNVARLAELASQICPACGTEQPGNVCIGRAPPEDSQISQRDNSGDRER